jgi:hypothetical protein
MGRYGGGRHGMSYGYGGYGGGDYPRGGEDEYERNDESEEVHLFRQEFPNFEMELLDTGDRDEKEGLVLHYLRTMNKRNGYGYSEAAMNRMVPTILAAYGSY